MKLSDYHRPPTSEDPTPTILGETFPDNFNIVELNENQISFSEKDMKLVKKFLAEFYDVAPVSHSMGNWGRKHIEPFICEGLYRMGLYHLLVFPNICHIHDYNTYVEHAWGEYIVSDMSDRTIPWIYAEIRADCLLYIHTLLKRNGLEQYAVKLKYRFNDSKAMLPYMRTYKLDRFLLM